MHARRRRRARRSGGPRAGNLSALASQTLSRIINLTSPKCAESSIWLVSEGTHPWKLDVCRTSIARTEAVSVCGRGGWATACPLWVISRHFAVQSPCPLYPRKRTSANKLRSCPTFFRGQCCKPFNASAMALSRLGWRSVAASMTARNGLSFSEITLRRVALVVIVNPD